MADVRIEPPPQPLTPYAELRAAWVAQAQAQPLITLGLGATFVAMILLLLGGIQTAFQSEDSTQIRHAFLGGCLGFGGTALGACVALGLRGISTRLEDAMLGFAAGMMLAASAFSLILPGLDAAKGLFERPMVATLTVVLGMGLAVLLMRGLDYFTPHEHDSTGPCGPDCLRLSRVWLFVFAITLHNLPEGMAIGVGFSRGDWSVALPLTLAIAIQDIPEGLAVALALRTAGLPATRAVLVAVLTGLMEPLGALVGLGISSGFVVGYPVSMGLAAGAMIFVVSHEV